MLRASLTEPEAGAGEEAEGSLPGVELADLPSDRGLALSAHTVDEMRALLATPEIRSVDDLVNAVRSKLAERYEVGYQDGKVHRRREHVAHGRLSNAVPRKPPRKDRSSIMFPLHVIGGPILFLAVSAALVGGALSVIKYLFDSP